MEIPVIMERKIDFSEDYYYYYLKIVIVLFLYSLLVYEESWSPL